MVAYKNYTFVYGNQQLWCYVSSGNCSNRCELLPCCLNDPQCCGADSYALVCPVCKCLLTDQATVLLNRFSSICIWAVNPSLHMACKHFLAMHMFWSHFIIYSAVWKTSFPLFFPSLFFPLPNFPLPLSLSFCLWDFGVVYSTDIVDVAELSVIFSSRHFTESWLKFRYVVIFFELTFIPGLCSSLKEKVSW